MAFVEIEPAYRELLAGAGLVTPDDFLRLQGVIVCGHPDRHVAEVVLSTCHGPLRVFLKREHRRPWRDRLASAWAGCGFASKSVREFTLLRALRRAGVGCPEPLAAGEDGQGRAFLLLREIPGATDLRIFLKECGSRQRRAAAQHLGQALARLHMAGFTHPDLYSKHVLVRASGHNDGSGEPSGVSRRVAAVSRRVPDATRRLTPLGSPFFPDALRVAASAEQPTFHFLDWQRARSCSRLSWSRRCRDLAALHATVADELAGPRDRLACLRAYLGSAARMPTLKSAALRIHRASVALLRRRHVRELRQAPLRHGAQHLLWLDGEALCVTRAFREETPGDLPAGLRLSARPEIGGNRVEYREIALSGSRRATLVRRSLSRPVYWLWTWLRRKALASPELEQACTLFRLQRYGVATPRLLAFGQRHSRPWRTESFLLTEPPAAAVPLTAWLAAHAEPLLGAARKERQRLIRQAAEVLRRARDAGYAVDIDDGNTLESLLLVQALPSSKRIVLGGPEQLSRQQGRAPVSKDLQKLRQVFVPLCTQTESLRFLLSYLGVARLTPAAKRLAWSVVRRTRRRVMA